MLEGRVRSAFPTSAWLVGPFEDLVPGTLRPDLCVSIPLSQDSVSDQIAKFGDDFTNGCKLGWLILPEEKSVLLTRRWACRHREWRAPETFLTAATFFPDLHIL